MYLLFLLSIKRLDGVLLLYSGYLLLLLLLRVPGTLQRFQRPLHLGLKFTLGWLTRSTFSGSSTSPLTMAVAPRLERLCFTRGWAYVLREACIEAAPDGVERRARSSPT